MSIPLTQIQKSTTNGAYNSLNDFLVSSFNQTKLEGGNKDIFRTFEVKHDQIANLTRFADTLFIGMLSDRLHWINIHVLPAILTDDIHFRTITREIEHASLTAIPALGTSRTHRTKSNESTSTSKRYGTGVFMESDFKNSDAGRDEIMINLMYFAGMAVEKLAFVSFATLQAGNGDNRNPILNGPSFTKSSFRQYLIDERDNFALCNKHLVGINKVILQTVDHMETRQKIRPNFAIGPRSKMSAIMKTGNKQYYQNDLGGDSAVQRLTGDVDIDVLNGIRVREAPPFSSESGRADLERKPPEMNRDVFVGQFFDFKKYPGQNVDTINGCSWGVYDNVADKRVYISEMDLFLNCGRFSINEGNFLDGIDVPENQLYGFTGYYEGDDPFNDEKWSVQTPNSGTPLQHTNHKNISDTIETLKETLKTAAEAEKEGIQNEIRNKEKHLKTIGLGDREGQTVGYWFSKISFLGLRPMDGYRMQDMMLVAGGDDLGFAAHSNFNISVGQDVSNASWSFEWRGWIGAHVKDWRRVQNVQNVFYDGIISGGNSKLIDTVTAEAYKTSQWDLNNDIQKPSIYAVCYPKELKITDDIIMNLGGRNRFYEQSDQPDYPGSAYYSDRYGFDQLTSATYSGLSEYTPISQTLFLGSLTYVTTGGGVEHIKGHSHHGPNEETGCEIVRRKGLSVVPSPLF
jgi:hypothetical protein